MSCSTCGVSSSSRSSTATVRRGHNSRSTSVGATMRQTGCGTITVGENGGGGDGGGFPTFLFLSVAGGIGFLILLFAAVL